MLVLYEAVSDQGPVCVQSEDKIPRASKSNFEVEILISLVSLLPHFQKMYNTYMHLYIEKEKKWNNVKKLVILQGNFIKIFML